MLSQRTKESAYRMTYQELLDNLNLTLLGLIEEKTFRLQLEQSLEVAAEYDAEALAIWEVASYAPLVKIEAMLTAQVLDTGEPDT